MSLHIKTKPHLKQLQEHSAILATYIGQAHIAGSGPQCRTCRECAFYGRLRIKDGERVIESPGHFAASNKVCPGALKKGKCNYEIGGKAARSFPHHAPACRFFQPNENAPLPMKAPKASM